MMNQTTPSKPKLSLVKTDQLTPAMMYGIIFNGLADQLSLLKENAAELYEQAMEERLDPEDMNAGHSLVELGLASYIEGVTSIDGIPEIRYSYPYEDAEKERVKSILLGFDYDEDDDNDL